ncbi:MAG: hypothetical protein KJP04_02765, partial [Arenicella sp.]|nr:hypothetical protein [Arenicella sp.]
MIKQTRNTLLGAVLSLGLILLSPTVTAQQYKQLSRMGTSEAVCSAGVQNLQQLQQFFNDNSAAVRSILSDSQWAGSADALFAAVAAGNVMEGSYPVGTKMAWMGANVKGQYMAKPYRQWAGSKSFAAYKVNVSSGCQVYEIAIPKECCNISLVSVSPDNSSECTSPNATAGLGAGTT